VVILLLTGWLSLLPIAAPAPPETVDGGFSGQRAMEVVTSLAATPRVTGTEGHHRAASELKERLAALSPRLEVETEEANHYDQADGGVQHVIRVRNILARLPGEGGGGGALLLVAHYDSVSGSPGAADNAAAVAALVETLRQLAAGPPLQQDVVVLFSDSEEIGLTGARAFVEEHPWAEDVAAVLNFEARGTQGPSIMFETGPASGGLVDVYAEVAPSPVANSISELVYSLLPNDTDFSVFREAGEPGLNFAFIDGAGAYHNAADTPEQLSPASLHHHGSTALALARALGDGDAVVAGPPRVFFTLPGIGLVVHPRSWVLPLTLATVALGVLVLVLAARRNRAAAGGHRRRRRGEGRSSSPLRAGLGGLFLLPALLTAVVLLVVVLERLLSGALGLGPRLLLDNPLWYAGWAAAGAGLALAGLLFWARRFGQGLTAFAGPAWGLLLTLGAGLAAPSTAHLFLWPALAGALAMGLVLAVPAGRLTGASGLAAMLVTAAAWCLMWVPVSALVVTALGPRSAVVLAMVAVLGTALLGPVLLAALAPAGSAGGPRRSWAIPGLLVLAGLVLAGIGGGTASFSPDLPQPTSVYYMLDADAGEAWWMTLDTPPEPWTAGFVPADHGERSFPRFLEGVSQELASVPAPVLPVEPPRVEVVSDQVGDEGRRLELLLSSRRRAWRMAATVRSEAPLTRLEVDGRPLPVLREVREEVTVAGGAARARLRFEGQPPGGYRIVLVQETPAPLRLDLTDWRQELPPPAAGDAPWPAAPPSLDPRLRSGTFRRLELPAAGAAAPRDGSGSDGAADAAAGGGSEEGHDNPTR